MEKTDEGLAPAATGAAGDARDARRADFVQATLACLAEHGYHGTTVRRIAERAGVAPGLLTHYFSGKEALIAAAYAALGERLTDHFDDAVAAAGADPKARLAAFVRSSFGPSNIDPDLLRIWVGFWSLVVTDPAVRAIHADTYAAYRDRVAGLVRAVLADEGRAIDDPDAGALAIGISALLDGLWLELCLDDTVFDADTGQRIALEMISARIGVPVG